MWLATYHHTPTNPKTIAIPGTDKTRLENLSFHNRPWAVKIYSDDRDKIVIRKSSQIGMTDWALCELFNQAMNKRPVMYILPTDVMVYDFSPRRIDKVIQNVRLYNDAYRKGRKDSDSKKQKTLWGVECHIVGSNADRNFFEKPVDVLIIDELDKCDQINLPLAYSRLGASTRADGKAQQIWRKLGNPSISGCGIDEAYENSDKKQWWIPCSSCGEYQVLDWWTHFVRQDDDHRWILRDTPSPNGGSSDPRPLCRHCSKPMDRLAMGEWREENPAHEISGYYVSKLFADPRDGAIQILFDDFIGAQSNQTELQIFYNQGLGLPFKADGSGFDKDIFTACSSDYKMPATAEGTVAGVDVGSMLHVHISTLKKGIRTKVFVGSVPFDELHLLAHRYNVRRGCIDLRPEAQWVQDFCKKHRGWYSVEYVTTDNIKGGKAIDHKAKTVKTNRTVSLDESFAHYAEGRVELPIDWRSLDNGDFVKQMTAATRVLVTDNRGNKRFVWDEGSKADHHQHADNYERLASTMYASGDDLVR